MKLYDEYERRNKYEEELNLKGYKCIVGIDEVGRGPLAGPLCVGAVVLDQENKIYGLKDSKKLSFKQIEKLSGEITEKSLECHTTFVSAKVIDSHGIKKAFNIAVKRILDKFEMEIDYILVDYEKIKYKDIQSLSIIKGDDLSNSIAAASILAKYKRDTYMHKLAKEFPEYGFDTHVGYGTKKHVEAIAENGPLKGVHRFSFRPIRKE